MQTFVNLKKIVPMASLFVKWLVLPLFLSSLSEPVTGFGTDKTMHPFYMAVTEINENKNEKVLEISSKMFTDDFEKVLTELTKEKVDLVNPNRVLMDKLISDYFNKHLQILIDDKPVKIQYLGFQQEEESVYSFLEVTGVSAVKKLTVKNKLLHDLNENQINIIHAIINGSRKSTKLDFPKSEVSFKW
jgi:hypothetical protein